MQVWGAGEDTALAPLLPDLLAVLQGGGEIEAARIAAVGGRYIKEMRERLPPERAGARWFVDKMLRNAWCVWWGGVGGWPPAKLCPAAGLDLTAPRLSFFCSL